MIWLDPPKGFSVDRHMAKVQSIARKFKMYEGKKMSNAVLEDMCAEVVTKMRYSSAPCLRTLLPSIVPGNGDIIDGKALMRLGMFLLEHGSHLSAGKYISEWNGTPTLWAASLVTDSKWDKTVKKGQKSKYRLATLALNGPPAGIIIETRVTPRYAAYLPMMLGVSKRTKIDVLPADAIGMVFYGQYGSVPGMPFALREKRVSSAMKTKNKRLFQRRHPDASV